MTAIAYCDAGVISYLYLNKPERSKQANTTAKSSTRLVKHRRPWVGYREMNI